jgi:hypothetical protein
MLQIERCTHATYGATIVRRKHHRETVKIPTIAGVGDYPCREAMTVNLSEGWGREPCCVAEGWKMTQQPSFTSARPRISTCGLHFPTAWPRFKALAR